MGPGAITLLLCLGVVGVSAGIVKRGTCSGNCADHQSGQGNAPKFAASSEGVRGAAGSTSSSTNNGNNNGNCKGNCIGNRNGNSNGNDNINSSNNGNNNGICHGNCFHNTAGNGNGNGNVNVDNNGNRNGNCFGNCFYRVAGNGKGNNNFKPLTVADAVTGFIEETAEGNGNDMDNCVGNCFDPQPMGRTANYDAEFKIAESHLRCDSDHGFTYYIMPETYCLEIYRFPIDKVPKEGQLHQYACPPGTVMDLDICRCNHWYFTNIISSCRSSYQAFNG